jgi:hypothetical protein
MSVLRGRLSQKVAARFILGLYIGGAVATALLSVTDRGGRLPWVILAFVLLFAAWESFTDLKRGA